MKNKYEVCSSSELITKFRNNMEKLESILLIVMEGIAESQGGFFPDIYDLCKEKLSETSVKTIKEAHLLKLVSYIYKYSVEYDHLIKSRDLDAIYSLFTKILLENKEEIDEHTSSTFDINIINFQIVIDYIKDLDKRSLDNIWVLVDNIKTISYILNNKIEI